VTALYCIVWAVIVGVTAWGIATARSCAAMARLRAEMRQEIAYWRDETARARTLAAQTARDAATRARGWKEGRDDVIAIMPLIVSARDGAGPFLVDDDDQTEAS
jgi:hypothetical protein